MAENLPVKTASSVDAERVTRQIESRFNPIRGLEPNRLAMMLDNFHAGFLADAARLWDTIERRDFQVQSVVPKRKRATALLDYQIITFDESEEATAQQEALEYFYDNLDATDALDQDQHGDFALLIEQMMDAVGKQYAVHEILWQPQRVQGQDRLTARLVHTPLWFFEHRTGKLRFLATDYAQDGTPLEDGGWLITSAQVPLMEATSVAYMFKNLSLRDWLMWSERYGQPLVHATTSAKKGDPEWVAYSEALSALDKEWRILTGGDTTITFHDLGAAGERPQQPLVEYMDTAITVLWRGGDLSTKSNDATGATQQEEERENIEQADALMVSRALRHFIDKKVIAYLFGTDAPVLAYVEVTPKTRVDTERELKVWDFAATHGIETGVSDFRKHFRLPSPGDNDTRLTASTSAPSLGLTDMAAQFPAANARRIAALRDLDDACAANVTLLNSPSTTASNSAQGARRLSDALAMLMEAHQSTRNHALER